jgi:nickel-dependent lactate racemase
MKHILEFAKTHMEVTIKDNNLSKVLHANEVEIQLMGEAEVARAMENPIGTPKLRDIAKPGEKVAIITSDITRPMPSKLVLPYILKELEIAGVNNKDISVVFALGSHRKHTEEEMRYLVGDEVFEKVSCIDSDMDDFVHFGYTENETPIDIFSVVAKADRRICLGNIEFHYFAGYSGGAKAIMPGVSTRAAIQANHKRMVEEKAHAGNLTTNPVRIDIEATIALVPIDFILNVVLNEEKEVIKAVAGHHVEAHREGCRFLDSFYKISIKEKADIVIVSAGGFPKDLNLYQAQKALDNSKHAVKNGGIIILVASCKEGLGEHVFEEWITQARQPSDLIDRVKAEFKLGGHKAAAIAMVLEKARIFLVSDLEDDFVKAIFLEPYQSIQEAFDSALTICGDQAQTIIIPHGGSILPVLQ